MNITSGRCSNLEIKETEAASTRVNIINNNRNDDYRYKI